MRTPLANMLERLVGRAHPRWTGMRMHATRSPRSSGRQQFAPDRLQRRREEEPPPRLHPECFLVFCSPGLEEVARSELMGPNIGAEDVRTEAPGVLTFSAPGPAPAYRVLLWSRCATRVMHQLGAARLDPGQPAGDTVYEFARECAEWDQLLPRGQTLSVNAHLYSNTNVTHSLMVAKRVRDAICDAVREATGARPAPPEGPADLPLYLSLIRDRAVLYRDLSGSSLHRRGYRGDAPIHKAALGEAAAAGLLMLAGWEDPTTTTTTQQQQQQELVLADPMCGSGTFLVEAALMATHTAPGLLREAYGLHPACLGWPDHRQALWQQLLEEAREASWLAQLPGDSTGNPSGSSRSSSSSSSSSSRAGSGRAPQRQAGSSSGSSGLRPGRAWDGQLLGNDHHQGAISLAAAAAAAAGVFPLVRLQCGPVSSWQPAARPQLVVTNPPWGLRLMGPQGTTGGSRGQQGAAGGGRGAQDGAGPASRMGSRRQQQQEEEQGMAELEEAWSDLGGWLKEECAGATAWVLSGAPGLTGALGMRSAKKRAVTIAGLKVAWLKYEVRASSE